MVKVSKKVIIGIVIFLCVLIGGGIGYYFYDKNRSEGSTTDTTDTTGTTGTTGTGDKILKLKMKPGKNHSESTGVIQVLNGDDDTLIKKFPKDTFTKAVKDANKDIVFTIKGMKTLPGKLKLETTSADGLVLDYVKIDDTGYGKDGKVGVIVVDSPKEGTNHIVTITKIS